MSFEQYELMVVWFLSVESYSMSIIVDDLRVACATPITCYHVFHTSIVIIHDAQGGKSLYCPH